jgi:hypothetical protein
LRKARVPWPTKKIGPAARQAVAFWRRRHGAIEYALLSEAFIRWLPERSQQVLVMNYIRRKGLLRTGATTLTRQPKVLGPDDRRRYLVIRRPLKTAMPK